MQAVNGTCFFFLGQVIFGGIDVAVLLTVLGLYRKGKGAGWLWWPILLLSKRIHSIFVLRLFNDCIAVLFGYIAIYCFLCRKVSALLTVLNSAKILLYSCSGG